MDLSPLERKMEMKKTAKGIEDRIEGESISHLNEDVDQRLPIGQFVEDEEFRQEMTTGKVSERFNRQFVRYDDQVY